MPQISGYHHVSLPAADVLRTGDWYERVFGFTRVMIEEDEYRVTALMLGHHAGIILYLHQAPAQLDAWRGPLAGAPVLGFLVADHAELTSWDAHLTGFGVEHSGPRQAHVGWALDVVDPDGLRIQLHTHEAVSADGT
jgi:glyoxylase I family protein